MLSEFYNFNVITNKGISKSLEEYAGKVILIVNTASKCGFTPQYEGLQKLYEEHKADGFEILGFPCDQFAHQEPGSDEEIAQFCKLNFGVTFPLFQKINVNGKNTAPLYIWLKKTMPGKLGKKIKWNFTKFLIDRDGNPVKRFSPKTEPADIENEILKLL